MKYKLICNGDSWTFGSEITDPKVDKIYGGPKKVYRGTYDFKEENAPYRTQRIWSTYIREYLDCDTVNLGWPADDNTTILNRTIDFVTREYLAKGKSTDELIVVTGWSSPERNSFWWHDEEINWHFRLWPNVQHFDRPLQKDFWKIYIQHMWTTAEFIPRYIMNNITLQSWCEANNIKYLTYNSFYQIEGKDIQEWRMNIRSMIDKMAKYQYSIDFPDHENRWMLQHDWMSIWNTVKSPNFYKKDKPDNTFNDFIQTKLKDPYIGLHPSPEGHKVWAKELARYIKKYIL